MASSSTPIATLTEDYSCGYCLQRLAYMTDPRALPCSHVFCLPCLQADFLNSGSLECAVCGNSHSVLDISALTKVDVDGSVDECQVEERNTRCDICHESGSDPPISYCIDCGKVFCMEHFKMHEVVLQKSHSTIDISVYRANPSKYEPEMCQDHVDVKLSLACTKCYKTLCVHCGTDAHCEDGKAIHSVRMLEKFAQNLRESLRVSLKSLSDKITEVCKLEKEAWKGLDDTEVNANELTKEVDRDTQEQTSANTKDCRKIRKKIQQYLEKSTQKVEGYTAELRSKREDMENLWRSNSNLIEQRGDAQLITAVKAKPGDMENAVKERFIACKLKRGSLIPSGSGKKKLKLRFEIGYPSLPKTLICSHNINVHCYSVNWTKDRNLITSGFSGITLYDKNLANLDSLLTKNCESIVEYDSGYAAMLHRNSIYCSTLFSKDFKLEKEMGKVLGVRDAQQITFNSAASSFIAVDTKAQQLLIYTLEGDFCKTIKLLGCKSLRGIHSLSDGSVLVSDGRAGTVHKYDWSGEPTRLWTCKDLKQPHGMSSDSECIYVASGVGLIYVLSEFGKMLTSITTAELDVNVIDVAVSGDRLAVACGWKGLKIFNLIRE